MACDQVVSGIARQCKTLLGGTSKIYIFNFVENAFTVSAGTVTAVSSAVTQVYEFEITGDLSTLTEVLTTSRNEGTATNLQTLVVSINGISAAAGETLNKLAYSTTNAVVKDRNGIWHALGILDGFDFNIEQNSGGAKTDKNGYLATGVSTTNALSPKMNAAAVTAFLAKVVPNP
jgi:hypothetical protein